MSDTDEFAIPTDSRLSDVAYRMIKDQIIRCELAPGAEVTESELAQLCELGKAPIRAALLRLAQQGLVRPVHRRGYVIAPITVRDVNDIFQLRLFLEPQAARLAASQKIDPASLERLTELSSAGYFNEDSDSTAAFIEANHEFHVRIARLSGNGRLASAIEHLLEEMARLFHLGLSLRNRTSEMQREHRQLLQALVDGDADKAERVISVEILAAHKMVMDAIFSRSEILDVNITDLAGDHFRKPRMDLGTHQRLTAANS